MRNHDSNRVIQGLWIGPELSVLERLSISSFLANGHEYHLYAYEDVASVPHEAALLDASEILPARLIFQYQKHKSFSAFSNFFRYKLLLERGGWWADLDTICIRSFDFSQDWVFSSESANGQQYVNCGVMKAPPGSPPIQFAWDVCGQKDPANLKWGEVGPRLVAESVKRFSLEAFVMEPEVFCPFGYDEWRDVIDPNKRWSFSDSTYAVHLWNEMWRRNDQDKNECFDSECLYEQLKRTYLS